ncbi:hypothetical protein [Catenulispora rubra]|nr:hypothetical protein [Catenulispora rubra]
MTPAVEPAVLDDGGDEPEDRMLDATAAAAVMKIQNDTSTRWRRRADLAA